MDEFTICCFGDSLTYGFCADFGKDYVSLFRKQIKEDFPDKNIVIRNKGENGESSRDGLRRLDIDILKANPKMVIMLFGSNDSAYNDCYHVGLDEYSHNYDLMIEAMLKQNIKIVLVTPTPVIEDEDLIFIENSALNKYCDVVREKAKKYKLDLIDLNTEFTKAAKGNLKPFMQWDGLHISTKGYEVFFNIIYKTVKPIIEKMI